VISLLPRCADASTAWAPALSRLALEAHSLLEAAWPDSAVDMGAAAPTAEALEAALATSGVPRLLPPLAAAAAAAPSAASLAATVGRHFAGLTAAAAALLRGDSSQAAVVPPCALLLSLVERVLRAVTAARPWSLGAAAVVAPAQGGLSPAALQLTAPALIEAAIELLAALAAAPRGVLSRFGARYSRSVA
jgi:hypothetical protein